jgi:acyl-CoA synthetase (NDP forming)
LAIGKSGDSPDLDYLFHPGSIAVVGVSKKTGIIASGQIFLRALIDTGFKGRVYAVSREGGEILGLRIYAGLRDIPDKIDYVISAIPARDTPQLIIDCAAKGVKAIHMFSAGFSEIADEEGKQLQSQITAMARQRNIRIIGPNCMGLHCPSSGLAFHPDMPKEIGNIAFISQSGGNAIYALREGGSRGIYFSKVISYGNASDLDECDFLEYLIQDLETEVVAIYIEGVRNGARFIEALKRVTRVKPVIVYKGGSTESGTRAVASHTGAIAGSDKVWESLLKQVGAIQVYSIEEMIDMLMLFRYMSPPEGRAAAIIGIGGGNSVRAADACSNAGLTVPLLPAPTRDRLKAIYASEVGGSFRNPVDTYFVRWDLLQETIEAVADCKLIDFLMIHITIGFAGPRYEKKLNLIQPYVDLVSRVTRAINKPAAIILYPIGLAKYESIAAEAEATLFKAGLPVFPLVGKAAEAIARFIDYHEGR